MVLLTEFVAPRPAPWWPLLKQVGINDVVAVMRGAEQEQRMYSALQGAQAPRVLSEVEEPWGLAALAHDVGVFREHGFRVAAIEDTPPMDAVRLGLPGRDAAIDQILTQVRAMGALEIPVLCYNWMASSSWSRTRTDVVTRGGALVTAFSAREARDLDEIELPDQVDEAGMWQALEYFLAAVLPVAEESGVRISLHPDDPPLPSVRGVPRIASSLAAFRRLLDISDSRSNAITFCQGNFALMTTDLPAAIREFGSSIAFVHFRDVRGSADDFVETFHDDGQTDMAECLRAYRETGFTGPLRPDHVPTMAGESNESPGYHVLGRLFAAGYIRGLEHALGA